MTSHRYRTQSQVTTKVNDNQFDVNNGHINVHLTITYLKLQESLLKLTLKSSFGRQ